MRRILSQTFFNRPALVVARDLLGKFLVRKIGRKTIAVMITEVEAYDGPLDMASHAHRGRTPRNEIMFGEAGYWYLYFTYGMHWMLNVVTGPKNYPAAVLIRAGIPARELRNKNYESCLKEEINGPARLTKLLQTDKKFNKLPVEKKTYLWIEDRGTKISPSKIKRRARIGVDYAGAWAKKPYNFKITEN